MSNYKNNIMLQLLTNDNLVKALTSNRSNFLDDSVPSDVTTLLYTQIFPFRQVIENITEIKSYITMAFTNFKPLNNSQVIKNGKIYFYVVVHESLIRTDEGLRYDYIISEIDQTFNGSRGMGIGKLDLNEFGDLPVNKDYFGAFVSYNIIDFQ